MEANRITDIVKDNKVNFSFFRDGNFYYIIIFEGNIYQFPVPLAEIGTLQAEDKAILFMRYIRKAIDVEEFVKVI